MPHRPAWIEDVVASLVEEVEAEAVFLVGSQARGDATPASDYDLMVLVDNERVPAPSEAIAARFERREGDDRPVDILLTSLAEVMAGLFSGHPGWLDLAREADPLHDPLDLAKRVRVQLQRIPLPSLERSAARARAHLEEAREAATTASDPAVHLLAYAALESFLRDYARVRGVPGTNTFRSVMTAAGASPGVARALAEFIAATETGAAIAAAERVIAAVQAAIRLRET